MGRGRVAASPTLSAVVFDLDGTLIDSRRDLAAALNHTRRHYGLADLEVAAVVAMVGQGARKLVERGLADAGGDGEGGIDLEAALSHYLAAYEKCLLATTVPYPGIPEAVAALALQRPLAVLTNKTEAAARRILEGLDLARFFGVLVGGDTLPTAKPDPAGLHAIAGRLEVPVGALCLVGDSAIDAAAAAAAGCPFAFAAWGFAGNEERRRLLATPGQIRLDHPGQLAGLPLTG